MVMVSSGLKNLAEIEWSLLMTTTKNDEAKTTEASDFKRLLKEISQSSISVNRMLDATNGSRAKEEFLVNYALRQPRNEYGNLSGRKASDNLCEIRVLGRKLRLANISRKEYALLEMMLDENEKKNKFVLANYLYNGLVGNTFGKMPALDNDNDGFVDYDPILKEKIARARDLHYLANVELYGEISAETFWSLLDEKLENIGDNIDFCKKKGEYQVPDQDFVEYDDIAEAETEYEELLALVGPRASATYDRYQPRRSIFDEFSAIIQEMGAEGFKRRITEKKMLEDEIFQKCVDMVIDQAKAGKFDRFAGATSYIAIGLATIMHYDFRRVFEIIWRMEKLTGKVDKNRAFDYTQRAFRGTGVLPNNKDLAYYRNTEKIWHYIEKNIDKF
jgi:hypothetical protein